MLTSTAGRDPVPRAFELCGHRGARGLWPENTLAGFAGALGIGVDAIELDVMLSADGVAVVTHDARLDPKMARNPDGTWLAPPGPRVADLPLAALRRYDLGRARPGSAISTAHPRQRAVEAEPIPTLREVVQLLAGTRVRLDVELKSDPADPAPDALVATVLAVTASRPQLAIRSFDWRALAGTRARRPSLPLGFLTEAATTADLDATRRVARPGDAWAPHHRHLSAALVGLAHASGLLVKPWTVNDPADMRRLLALGVDGFCTDDPDLAHPVLREGGRAVPPPVVVRWPGGELPSPGPARSLPA